MEDLGSQRGRRDRTGLGGRSKARRNWGTLGLVGVAALLAVLPLVLLRSGAASAATGDGTGPGHRASAEALRSCAFDTTLRPPKDRESRVLLGLAADACGDPDLTAALLKLPAEPTAELEDWRLYALAEAAAETGELATASAAADILLLDHGNSPLRHRAFALRARIARQAGEAERALSMARASRAAPFPDGIRTELDVLAWEVASELDDAGETRQEARQLLLHAPLEAIELKVEEALAVDGGELDWSRYFEPWELSLRANRLVELDMVDEALEALDAVAENERDISWSIARARALIEDKRGIEAYELLGGVTSNDAQTQLDLAWLRAEAALDAATVRRGRQNLPADRRDEMRRIARQHLRDITRRGDDDELTVAALRRLFDELTDDDDFAEVKTVLAHLRDIDPRDTSGARYVWRLGWHEYTSLDFEAAIHYWQELAELYPDSLLSRSGRYWSGRCHEALGDSALAQATFEQIAAAPATDYYRKHALIRLGREGTEVDVRTVAAAKPWPSDPALERAARLSDLGVDQLGLEELELVAALAAEPAVDALRSRILARQGRRRESIQSLWRAFPTLGTPDQVTVPGDALRMYYPVDFLEIVERFAADNRLEVHLLLAMIRQESAFDVQARSWAGARGLMQVMPATGRELAQRMGLPYSRERLNDPAFSVQLGSRYFRQVLDMFDGNLELALAGYNAGPYRIRKLVRAAGPTLELDSFLEGLRIEESKTYVKRVVLFSNSYAELYPDLG